MSDEIVMLRGPERVRRRPAVIFGCDDVIGAMTALKMLLFLFAEEGSKGHSHLLAVTQYQDGSMEIRSSDRGIFLGSPNSSDDTVWKELFCELYTGPLYKDGASARCIFEEPSDQQGEYADNLELYSVQCASEYMDVSVVRDGFRQSLHFEKGYNTDGISRNSCTDPSGTCIRFKLDPEVFSEIALPKQQIANVLQELALQIPGMKTVFRCDGPQGPEEVAFHYPKGIADFLQEQNRSKQASPVYSKERSARGQDRYNSPCYFATVSSAVCFAKNAGFIKCYHNLKEIAHGGLHCDGALRSIAQRLEWMLELKISQESLRKHLQLLIVTNAEGSDWYHDSQSGLQRIFIRDLTQDTIGDDFQHFVKQNKEFLYELFSVD